MHTVGRCNSSGIAILNVCYTRIKQTNEKNTTKKNETGQSRKTTKKDTKKNTETGQSRKKNKNKPPCGAQEEEKSRCRGMAPYTRQAWHHQSSITIIFSHDLHPFFSLLLYLVFDKAFQHFSFDECWPCAPLTQLFKFFLTDTTTNIPPQISTLTKLTELYAHHRLTTTTTTTVMVSHVIMVVLR